MNQTSGGMLPTIGQSQLDPSPRPRGAADPDPTEDTLDRYKILRDLLIRNNVMAEFEDRKAAILLAFAGVASKVVFDPIAEMGPSLYRELLDGPSAAQIALAALVIALGVTFSIPTVAAITFAFRALRPTIIRDPESSQMFFADVAAMDRATWERGLMQATATDLTHDLAIQVHATARITAAKHANVNRAINIITRYSLPIGLALYVIASLY